MKFGINDVWNAGREKKAGQYKEIYLDPRTVKEAEENTHVSLENIEELADSFLTVGQEQPTVLAKIDNEFWIIDGHRRNAANIYNLERGHKEYERVLYRYKEMSKTMYELCLLAGNAYTQELTPYEKTRIVERMKVALIRAKEEDGLEIVGKMRDLIATMVGESSTNIARMEAINKNATPEIKEQFRVGNLGISGAYEASKLTGEDQKEVAKQAENGMQAKEIAKIVREKKAKEAITSADPVLEEQIPGQMEIENDFPEVLPAPASDLVPEDEGAVTEESVSESDTLTLAQKKNIFEEVVKNQRRHVEYVKSHWPKERTDIYWRELMKLEAYEQYFKKLSEG